MGLRDVRTAVRVFLAANWTATEVAFENEDYEPKTDGNAELVPWVFVEVMGGLYDQRSIGAGTAKDNYWVSQGQLWLHLFVASGSGTDLAAGFADDLAELFRGLELDPVISFGDINIAAGGGESDGNGWRLSISIEWTQG